MPYLEMKDKGTFFTEVLHYANYEYTFVDLQEINPTNGMSFHIEHSGL